MPQIFRKKQAPMKFLILRIWNVSNLMTLSDAHCWNHEGSVLHRLKQVINLNYCFSARSCAIYWTLFFALICLLAIFGLYCFSLGILCYIGILVLVYCYIYIAILCYIWFTFSCCARQVKELLHPKLLPQILGKAKQLQFKNIIKFWIYSLKTFRCSSL